MNQNSLRGKVALVTGGTRGAGRGISVSLGAAGATVYVTRRSAREKSAMLGRPESIEETAEKVTAQGGQGIAVRVDHTDENEVRRLFERIRDDNAGRLDILVNDIWGGDELSEWSLPFWEQSLDKGRLMLDRAVQSHIITSRYGVPLMVKRNSGLVIEVTDGMDYRYCRSHTVYISTLVFVSKMHCYLNLLYPIIDTKNFLNHVFKIASTKATSFLKSEYSSPSSTHQHNAITLST